MKTKILLIMLIFAVTNLFSFEYQIIKPKIDSNYTIISIENDNEYITWKFQLNHDVSIIYYDEDDALEFNPLSFEEIKPSYKGIVKSKNKFISMTTSGLALYIDGKLDEVINKSSLDIKSNNFTSYTEDGENIYFFNNSSGFVKYDGNNFEFIVLANNLDSLPLYNIPKYGIGAINGKVFYVVSHLELAYHNEDKVKIFDESYFPLLSTDASINSIKRVEDSLYIFIEDTGKYFIYKWFNDEISLVSEITYLFEDVTPYGDIFMISNVDIDDNNNLWISAFDSEIGGLYNRIVNQLLFVINDKFELLYKIDAQKEFGDGEKIERFGSVMQNKGNPDDHSIYLYAKDGLRRYDITTSVESQVEISENFYLENIFPNPTMDIINIELMTNPHKVDDLKISIYNYLGQVVVEPTFDLTYNNSTGIAKIEVNLDKIPQGYYFLGIDNGTMKRAIPIIKE